MCYNAHQENAMNIPNDIVIFRRIDEEGFQDTCKDCPAFSGSAEKRNGDKKQVDVACVLLDTAPSGQIAGVNKLIREVLGHFDGANPQCGAMKLATARLRSRGQIKRRTEEKLFEGYA